MGRGRARVPSVARAPLARPQVGVGDSFGSGRCRTNGAARVRPKRRDPRRPAVADATGLNPPSRIAAGRVRTTQASSGRGPQKYAPGMRKTSDRRGPLALALIGTNDPRPRLTSGTIPSVRPRDRRRCPVIATSCLPIPPSLQVGARVLTDDGLTNPASAAATEASTEAP